MSKEVDPRLAAALESQRGADLAATLEAIDVQRTDDADPIYPSEDDLAMDIGDARSIVARFRAIRDAQRGEVVADRAALPEAPGRVAAAVVAALQADLASLEGAALQAAQRAGAEDLVDLQSFRPTEEVDRIAGRAGDGERLVALERLMVARAAAITMIREDPSVLGAVNAIGSLDIRIGDARVALDAVNRYRERQALGFLKVAGLAVASVIGVIVIAVVLLANR